MQITILGAGAIGCLWACRLAKQGHHIHFWTRTNKPSFPIVLNACIQTKDSIQAEDGTHKKNHIKTPLSPEHFDFTSNNIQSIAKSELIIVTVKAFQVEQALNDIVDHTAPHTPIMIMHNGMGTQQHVKTQLIDHPILYATTSQAAFKPNKEQINHTGLGPTWIGAFNQSAQDFDSLAELFDQALAPCGWHHDINEPLWQKLAINCAINPLTAIHQCQNGELANPKFHSVLTQVCHEVAEVMQAEDYDITAEKLKQTVDTVIKATAANYSSMYQDIFQQRKTEIDYITGYLITRAKVHGIAVPMNTQLWQDVKLLEQNHDDK
ncbi:2-dehydropantoate 2-reductase [Photobacterium profundum]|uniref:2-dehydropantoate 2-reductase n=1 Tax=Photobacterium profundum 3TCK TaxID=314280 RepID=Q1Z7M4_9GAMM|nr:2-dehydropantoate 2-reductase [Photobacterium profundum]EAS44435.1 2-dehydropantoate 2-reductase [Photobacterium profundum 3TCK]PSV64694.1 2-dehydropantoate 2-reductase [Photobacterium profundum]